MAHDFNNLLGVMLGNAELALDWLGENDEARGGVEKVVTAITRASSLTQRLLAFSRQQVLMPKATNVGALVYGVADMLRRTLGETIELKVASEPRLWLAKVDDHQLENALLNLAINARDAMPKGGVLEIAMANTTLDEAYAQEHDEVSAGDYVKLSVRDSGTGIPPEVLEKVFDPFFTTKEVGEGSGLGLSMVYGFVRQSHGHVTINSEVGHSTTVILYLPRSHEEVEKEGSNTENRPTPALQPARVLIVEDDDMLRELAVNVFRSQGFEVIEAGDVEQALVHIRQGGPFELLFSDIVLPGNMNGVEIADEARRLQPGLKVLFTTGYTANAVSGEAGIDRSVTVLNKPYRKQNLLEAVDALLNENADDTAAA